MKRPNRKHYLITIKLRSDHGTRPDVRTLGGDTIFVRMDDGQSAPWTLTRDRKREQRNAHRQRSTS